MKNKLFPLFVLFSAMGLASVAAYFSIIGISTLFAGASISVGIMALFLEIGKLSAVSFSYRYWNKCSLYLKTYLVSAIIILMLITSLGISGMLMSAYQKSSIEFTTTQEKIKTTEDQKGYYTDKIAASKKRIEDLTHIRESEESRMNGIITNEFISRNPVQLKQLQQQNADMISDTDNSIKDENKKIQDSIDGIAKVNDEVNQLKLGTSEKKDIQTFKFVADALGMSLDSVARWVILSIMFVFDPLAICLILAYNVIIFKKYEELESISIPPTTSTSSASYSIQPTTTIIDTPKIVINEIPNTEKIEKSEGIQIESIKQNTPNIQSKNNTSEFFKQMFKI